ncbi:MAG: hypothetical protein NVS3B26_21900 [Mycobacteriales bacterium]
MNIQMDETTAFQDIERRLLTQFGTVVPKEVIALELRCGMAALSEARIRTYLPVLVQRRVADQLKRYA